MQWGDEPLQVPSAWHILVLDPTNMKGELQLNETSDWYIKLLWVFLNTCGVFYNNLIWGAKMSVDIFDSSILVSQLNSFYPYFYFPYSSYDSPIPYLYKSVYSPSFHHLHSTWACNSMYCVFASLVQFIILIMQHQYIEHLPCVQHWAVAGCADEVLICLLPTLLHGSKFSEKEIR